MSHVTTCLPQAVREVDCRSEDMIWALELDSPVLGKCATSFLLL